MNQIDKEKLKAIENICPANQNAKKAAKLEHDQELNDQLMTFLRAKGIPYKYLLAQNEEDDVNSELPTKIQKLDLD